VAESAPTRPPATDALGWSGLAPELGLDGMARQVALNCIVTDYADQRLELALLPEMELLLKPEIRDSIRQAIGEKLGVSLSLEIRTQPELPCETPAQALQRLENEQRRQVIEAIREDPVVRELQQVFGAELIEDSVRKIES
jgi:DNA polymerase-3 subunit gamma/tau